MATIKIENLQKSFADFTAVKNSNLTINNKEFFVLLGPSGCGKTTTLRMIAGLELPTSGKIYLDQDEVSLLRASERDIAFVFQLFALYPHMNVKNNLAFPLKMQKYSRAEIKERVMEAAKLLRIDNILDSKISSLAGGDRQRVALGRALVRRPKAFLMDEPLGTLDAEFRELMCLELRKLHDDIGATTVYVTHDQVEAMTMADRIVVMNHGVIEQVGTPLELYRNPKNLFVAGFIGSPKMNFITGTWAQEQGAHTVGIRPEHISVTSEQSEWNGVVKMAESLGSDTFLHIQGSGVTETLSVRTDGEKSYDRGQEVFLKPKKDSLHLFNEQGERQ